VPHDVSGCPPLLPGYPSNETNRRY
jgi:hypothetical protein